MERQPYYTETIGLRLREMRRGDIDPRHIEAFMRVGHATLDSLTGMEFADEVDLAVRLIDDGGAGDAELLAKSYGL